MIRLNNISASYDEVMVLKNIDARFEAGKFYGVLGPNGSGKTTLLKVISNVLKPMRGRVELEGKPLSSYSSKEMAKKMAVLPQLNASSFSNTVRETVAIGRYPHQKGLFSSWSKKDEEAVQWAMEQTGVDRFEHMPLPYLSGGEQQRTFIAQALAQQAAILLLDEPTNHLDITHQKQSLDIVRKMVNESNLLVIGVFHDINLASIYCDEILLMEKGEIRKSGAPSKVIVREEIEQVYDATVTTYAHPNLPKPQISMTPYMEDLSFRVTKEHFSIEKEGVFLKAPFPLKTISSAVYNAGMGWYQTFINRNVAPDYHFSTIEEEVEQFLVANRLEPSLCTVMLTAVAPEQVIVEEFEFADCSLIVVVTAGIGHAIDVSKAYVRNDEPTVGTINTWVIVNGKLTDEAFVQAMITATEAKAKALQDEAVIDNVSETIASGTGTDSLLVAATQQGALLRYAGPLTTLGQFIGRGVYEVTRKAIEQYRLTNEKQ